MAHDELIERRVAARATASSWCRHTAAVQALKRARELMITMPAEHAVVELRRPGQDLDELRARRPTVYLDQNHWSTLAAVRRGHRPVSEGEAEAALRLAELVDAERILLPVSAGHLVETTPLHGAPRVALAGTVLTLGRGWQMRNPLHVRVEEMLHAVRGVEPVAAEVFAPGADGFFSSVGEPVASPSAGPEMPTELEQIGRLVPDVLGLYDAVVDEQAIPDEGGAARAAAESWACAHSASCDGERHPTPLRPSRRRLLADEIVRARRPSACRSFRRSPWPRAHRVVSWAPPFVTAAVNKSGGAGGVAVVGGYCRWRARSTCRRCRRYACRSGSRQDRRCATRTVAKSQQPSAANDDIYSGDVVVVVMRAFAVGLAAAQPRLLEYVASAVDRVWAVAAGSRTAIHDAGNSGAQRQTADAKP